MSGITVEEAARPPESGERSSDRPRPQLPLRLQTPLFGLGFLLVGTVVQLLRTPGVPPWNSVLAEDGGIFLTDALNDGIVAPLGRAYEGYLHVVPRLLAALASVFPVRDAAIVLNVGAALIVSALALFVWSVSRSVLPSRWSRTVLVALVVALPSAGYEVNASVNNLHWYLDFACFWSFAVAPQRRSAAIVQAVVAAAAALCDPLVVLYVPLAAYRVLRDRRTARHTAPSLLSRRWTLAAPVAFVGCLVLQFAFGVSQRRPEAFVPVDWRDLPGTYGLRVAGSLLVGDHFLTGLFDRFGLEFAYGCLLVAAAALAVAVLISRWSIRRVVLGTAAYSVVMLVVPLLLRGTSIYLDRSRITLDGSRYMLVPSLLLAIALLLAVEGRARARTPTAGPSRGLTVLRTAVVVFVAVVLGFSYRLHSVRSAGPDWKATVAAAAQRCRNSGGNPGDTGGSAANSWTTMVRPGQALLPGAPADPGGQKSTWNVVVSCTRLS